ncbi:regulatory protein RecX [Micromonospora sp. NPDC049559]|uniref:regulatory protein RecX n=1 Tax=Micromonospora sp. NPDC049559 TaxID=3155923 RepID=UPI003437E4FA
MAGRRRGARSGRGWDAAPPRPAGSDSGGGTGRSRRGRSAGFDPLPVDGTEDDGAARERSEPTRPRDEAELAREICLRQLAVRPRTRAELAGALARRGISEEVAAQVLDRYDEVGIIDDAAFARAWVTSRHQGRGLARRALANELRQRGVDGEIATEALGELDDQTEQETALALVERKLRSARGTPEQVFRRMVGMLARKGYPAGVAIRAVKEALAAQSAEAAEFAEYVDADALVDAEAELDREAGSVRVDRDGE